MLVLTWGGGVCGKCSLHDESVISVVIPAYNEETSISKCVMSVLTQSWKYKQIIIVDDGSKDKTLSVLISLRNKFVNDASLQSYFSKDIPLDRMICVVHQENSGKSKAINNAVMNYAIGKYVMILDADSSLGIDALQNMVHKFDKNSKLIACASNVQVFSPKKIIEFIQQIEYLISYRLKSAEALLNMEYIIGGVGSTFRKDAMIEVGLYDTDCITEDLDFTMKLIMHYGNKRYHFGFASDVITWTPAVHKYIQLFKQRLRWKYGLIQSFFKYKNILFNIRHGKYCRALCWWIFPKAIMDQVVLVLTPSWVIMIMMSSDSIIKGLIFFIFVLSAVLFAITVSIAENAYLDFKNKLHIFLLSPFAFLLLITTIIIDFVSVIVCIFKLREIKRGSKRVSWEHVDR